MEPRYDEGPRVWQNMFVKQGSLTYVEVLFHIALHFTIEYQVLALKPFSSPFWSRGRLQIKPSGSGDENALKPQYGHYLTHARNHITQTAAAMDSCFALIDHDHYRKYHNIP